MLVITLSLHTKTRHLQLAGRGRRIRVSIVLSAAPGCRPASRRGRQTAACQAAAPWHLQSAGSGPQIETVRSGLRGIGGVCRVPRTCRLRGVIMWSEGHSINTHPCAGSSMPCNTISCYSRHHHANMMATLTLPLTPSQTCPPRNHTQHTAAGAAQWTPTQRS